MIVLNVSKYYLDFCDITSSCNLDGKEADIENQTSPKLKEI